MDGTTDPIGAAPSSQVHIAQTVIPKSPPPSTSSRSERRKGMILPVDELPKEVQNLQADGTLPISDETSSTISPQPRASRRKGIVVDFEDLPPEVKALNDDAGHNTEPA
ncbi:hypothetical protein PTTG_05295 [Puccinia triticina 1-1 BBBD Race 1]|uniref:Uncharacterized protein n=2 Tax=Puccinia triticina TaxID=208348 RepID=A0A0C4EWU9_PUCT1|nr:hypothetical protein PTTG_05295 [Puccinia triticina 1-1 BBBD Race 1]